MFGATSPELLVLYRCLTAPSCVLADLKTFVIFLVMLNEA